MACVSHGLQRRSVWATTRRSSYQVVYVVGSLARGSINRQLAGALIKLAPPELSFTEASIAALPLYSYDFDSAFPEPARAFKQAIIDADAVLFVTPEYTRSIPGGLKNAIDWASRPFGKNAFTGKRCGVIGASPGKIGTAAAQQHLKNILNYCDAVLMNQPEAYIQLPKGLIAADGAVTDETTAAFLRTYIGRFGAFVAAGAARVDAVRA